MKKAKAVKPTTKILSNKAIVETYNGLYIIFLSLYILIPTYTPFLGALDSNGPRFLGLAVLNILSLLTLRYFSGKNKSYSKFWTEALHPQFIFLIVLLAFSGLSLLNSINYNESYIALSKLFNTVLAIYCISTLIKREPKLIYPLVCALTLLLFVDSFIVLIGVSDYFSGKIESVEAIKASFTNKNMMAAIVFIKLPFAIWLMIHGKKIVKFISYPAILLSVISLLFLSARAFYIGLILLTILVLLYLVNRYLKEHSKISLRILVGYVVVLCASFLMYYVIHGLHENSKSYTNLQSRYDVNFTERLGSINTQEQSTAKRIELWQNTILLIKQQPILGVGIGNWRIQQFKYEQSRRADYINTNKNHNDFLEIASETGLIGGLAFLAFFLFPLFILSRMILKNKELNTYVLLPLLGFVAYSLDAFFNFPSDRPENIVILGVYTGIFISLTPGLLKSINTIKIPSYLLDIIVVPLAVISIVVLGFNYSSLCYQKISRDEILSNTYNHSSQFFISGFPAIPDIGIIGDPISIYKTLYLWNEKKYEEAVSILKADKSIPFNARISEYIARSYINLNKPDSTVKYISQAIALKPLDFNYIGLLCNELDKKKEYTKAVSLLTNYLSTNKKNPKAWENLAFTYRNLKMEDKSLSVIDSGLIYCKGDTLLVKARQSCEIEMHFNKYQTELSQIKEQLSVKNYKNAIVLCNRILNIDSLVYNAYELRGIAYEKLKEYKLAIPDYTIIIKKFPAAKAYYNSRGVCYYNLKMFDAACSDFKTGAEKGDPDATSNFMKFCRKK